MADSGQIWGMIEMHFSGHSLGEIAERMGCSSSTVGNYLKRAEVAPHRCGPRPKHGGARQLDKDGYVTLKLAGDSMYEAMVAHRATRSFVREHRWVMAKHLGRLLRATETVHHKNGDRTDNRLENLELRQGAHGPGVALRCAKCGSHDLVHA